MRQPEAPAEFGSPLSLCRLSLFPLSPLQLHPEIWPFLAVASLPLGPHSFFSFSPRSTLSILGFLSPPSSPECKIGKAISNAKLFFGVVYFVAHPCATSNLHTSKMFLKLSCQTRWKVVRVLFENRNGEEHLGPSRNRDKERREIGHIKWRRKFRSTSTCVQ